MLTSHAWFTIPTRRSDNHELANRFIEIRNATREKDSHFLPRLVKKEHFTNPPVTK